MENNTCPKCEGEGFIIVEDVEIQTVKECLCCKGEGNTKAKNVENFLKELSDLTNKYGMEIGGCGCCDSPFLRDVKESSGEIIQGNIEYDKDNKKYTYEIL